MTGEMLLSQSKYIMDLLHRTKMDKAKLISPMMGSPILSAKHGPSFHDVYQL